MNTQMIENVEVRLLCVKLWGRLVKMLVGDSRNCSEEGALSLIICAVIYSLCTVLTSSATLQLYFEGQDAATR